MSEGGNGRHHWPPYTGAAVALVAALAGFLAIYVTLGQPDNAARSTVAAPPPVAGQSGSGEQSSTGSKLNSGHMAAFVFKKAPELLPAVSFTDADGRERTLADWRGRVVLLNLWATWCAPCRKEMPELDHLQSELGSDKFEVIALAVDRAGANAARKFLDQINAKALGLYVDAAARGATELKAVGLPTTLLIDREGREVGRLTGPAEWNSADAKRLIASLVSP